jgi:hypothetical protein
MKNGGYEYEIFNHFFGFPILKLVEPQIFRLYGHSFPFIFFYRLEYICVLKIVKNSEKKQKPKLFFFLLNLIINLYF